jgi:hypothetical protein
MFARLRFLALALVITVTTPALGHAQQRDSAREAPPRAAGPRIERSVAAVRQVQQRAESPPVQRRRQGTSKPVALMIVGGAAIVVGALIGGDVGTIFMVGGAVAGLIGLFQYLQ